MQRKTLDTTVKMAGDDGADDLGENEFLVVISDASLDRDGEIVDPKAFEPLPDKVNADIDHHMSVRNTVGSGRPYYDDDDRLVVRGSFASTPLGQETRTLVKEGHIDKTSIAFTRARREDDDDGVPHIVAGELLNFAFVSIPANNNARVLAAKGIDAGEPLYTLDEARKALDIEAPGFQSSTTEIPSKDALEIVSSETDAGGKSAGDVSTGDAPDDAPDDAAKQLAATRSAASRQRRSQVAQMRGRLALATNDTGATTT